MDPKCCKFHAFLGPVNCKTLITSWKQSLWCITDELVQVDNIETMASGVCTYYNRQHKSPLELLDYGAAVKLIQAWGGHTDERSFSQTAESPCLKHQFDHSDLMYPIYIACACLYPWRACADPISDRKPSRMSRESALDVARQCAEMFQLTRKIHTTRRSTKHFCELSRRNQRE